MKAGGGSLGSGLFRACGALLALAAGCATARAVIPNKHGSLFDGCPLCSSGRIGPDGTPLDPITGDVAANPDGLKPRPARPSAAGKSAPAPPPAPLPALKQRADGYWDVSFAHLTSFPFEAPLGQPADGAAGQKIPEEVRALDGKRVRIAGYMLPTRLEQGLAKVFLLLRTSLLCCFGITPAPTEWIVVTMKGKGAVPAKDVPLHFYGTLRVGERYQDGAFVGLYVMEGEKVSVE